jgi:hypothetical protein
VEQGEQLEMAREPYQKEIKELVVTNLTRMYSAYSASGRAGAVDQDERIIFNASLGVTMS